MTASRALTTPNSVSPAVLDSAANGRQAARFIVDRAQGRAVADRIVDIGFSIQGRARA